MIVNIVYILSSATGGGFKSFMNLLEELMKKGVKPTVVLPEKNEIYGMLSDMGVPTIIVPYRYDTYPPYVTIKEKLYFFIKLIGRRIVNYYAIVKVSRILSGINVDIIHTNVSVIGIGHYIAKRLKVPHVYHIREYGDLDFGYKYFPSKKNFVERLSSDYSICITKDIQKHFNQNTNAKSVVIYNGVQKEAEMIPDKSSGNYFLYLGDILPAKGTDILVKAYSEYVKMSHKPLPLYLAGRIAVNAYAEEIHKYIKHNNLEENIFFLDKQKDVKKLIRGANAIVIPSINEGFGRCMPEAMFCGCLAIAHNTGGSKEQLDNARTITGREVALHYDDPSELPRLLLQAEEMTDKEREWYVRSAFEVVNQLYTNEKNSNDVLQFYESILKTDGKL